MAKRKRLKPARNMEAAPETKSMAPSRAPLLSTRPPIADVAQDAAASSALRELADAMSDARESGRLIQRLPLEAIEKNLLMRDRIEDAIDDGEMAVLVDSIKARGQQTAIEVTDMGEGKFGLISGYRRLMALRKIAAENPEIDTVLAIIRQPEDSAEAYQAMVEENEVRVGLSFYERARIVVLAVRDGVYRAERVALAQMFAATTKSKRSKINAFLPVVHALDGCLPFPVALTEKQGLSLAKALETDATLADQIMAAFKDTPPTTGAEQTQIIAKLLTPPSTDPKTPAPTKGEVHQIRSGLTMTIEKGGRVVLEGERMTEAHFVKRLKDAINNL